jgi:hypothetical protein
MSLTAHANWFAFVALLAWPVLALWLFSKRSLNTALVWTILGGYLLLPVGASIKFEGVPAFDKGSIPNIAALIGCVLIAWRRVRFFYGFGWPELLISMLIIGPFITSALNSDTIVIGGVVLPGVGTYDALSAAVGQLISFLPFILARQFLRNPEDNNEIFRILVVAGLAYSVPVLFEVRMSPQLHSWIYGYFPHDFAQQIRDGGFRPVVFLGHGLLVAFFMMTAVVAAAAFWRTQTRLFRLPTVGIMAYLSGILIVCKTLGALVYGAVLTGIVRFTRPQLQLRFAMLLVAVALLYPMLRAGDLFPTRLILSLAETVSVDRAQSLQVRFENEDQLLDRAWQRFAFGWGRFGRSRIINEDSGKDDSITDGRWIITMGQFGFVGFLAEFGMLALAVVRAAAAFRFVESEREQIFLAALSLIVAINMIDLLPNASLSPWTWLLAGALLGRAEALRALALARRPRWRGSPRMAGN